MRGGPVIVTLIVTVSDEVLVHLSHTHTHACTPVCAHTHVFPIQAPPVYMDTLSLCCVFEERATPTSTPCLV